MASHISDNYQKGFLPTESLTFPNQQLLTNERRREEASYVVYGSTTSVYNDQSIKSTFRLI
jgi:hypothetical protein